METVRERPRDPGAGIELSHGIHRGLQLKALPLLLLLAYVLPAWAQPAYHSGTAHDCGFQTPDGSDHTTCAFSAAVSTGDHLVACVYTENGQTISGVSDSVNGNWPAAIDSANHGGGPTNIYCFAFSNSASGTPTVTATSNSMNTVVIKVIAYTGVKTSSALIATAHTNNITSATSPVTCTSASATAANQLVVGYIAGTNGAGGWAPNSGETERLEGSFSQLEDKLTSGSGSVSASWTEGTPPGNVSCINMIFDALATNIPRPLTGPLGGPLQGPL
jgi:hypothetical protein